MEGESEPERESESEMWERFTGRRKRDNQGREGGREGGWEGGREGGREENDSPLIVFLLQATDMSSRF